MKLTWEVKAIHATYRLDDFFVKLFFNPKTDFEEDRLVREG
ncbi:MAG: hypothetical protein ACO3JG_14525 [Luteolibacter sp.]